jgi:hypothetical protein
MGLGPVLIFDKSTLQSLNPDEALWLDNFYLANITPLFFVETLADLEKEIQSGRTPEQVVGNLAFKTPDMGSCPNVHHTTLLAGELNGGGEIDMRFGRPIISGGKAVTLGGKTGLIFEQPPEQKALQRWQRGEFLNVEREMAKAWRRGLSGIDFSHIYKIFQQWFGGSDKPKTLTEVKSISDQLVGAPNQERTFVYGLSLLGVPQHIQESALSRWKAAGKPAISEFAPYFRYVYSVDLFFYLAIAADLISRDRPSNKVDLAYLYYLPFCMVFTSNDKLHAKVASLFLRPDQVFLDGAALKADLDKLDAHYSSLPDEVKNRGILEFAHYPPQDISYLITQLWDKFLPAWREHQAHPLKSVSKEAQRKHVAELNRFREEAVPVNAATQIRSDNADQIMIQRMVHFQKGKWRRFTPEFEKAYSENVTNKQR